MQAIIDYFSTIPSLHRTAILVGGLTFFWVLESAIPLFRFEYKKWSHAWVNIFFTLTTIVVNFSLAFFLVRVSDHFSAQEWGLLHLTEMPDWLFCITGLLMLDLIGAYTIHFLEHKVKWMWQFHLVHHTDQHIDTTSANRHHPGESALRFVFTLLAVVLSGAPMWLVMIYQSLSVLLTQFNHSNIQINSRVDKLLGLVFCTPNIHRVHHHFRQPLTDSNYGNIFSFWDRMFGTFAIAENKSLQYGLDTYPDPQEVSSINAILKMPFQTYRTPLSYEADKPTSGS
jgi:sterol desaturase/sphingolipid hydroxylase (fatty acid hydroxylase superfamily)